MLRAVFKNCPILGHIFQIFVIFWSYIQNKSMQGKALHKPQLLAKYQCDPSLNEFIRAKRCEIFGRVHQ